LQLRKDKTKAGLIRFRNPKSFRVIKLVKIKENKSSKDKI